MKPKVFITRPLPTEAIERLGSRFDVAVHSEDVPIPKDELYAACRDIVGLLSVGTRVSEDLLQNAPKLRAISSPSVGVDHLDLVACTARGIPVTNTVGALEDTTADEAFALLLAAARRVLEADAYVRAGKWQCWQYGLLHGAEVHHKTLGVVGFGKIGRGMARRGRGFDMRILYCSRRRADAAIERELAAEYRPLASLLAESDFVSLHVPLTEATLSMIGARELALMKPTAFLINTARGKVVDEAALVRALEEKKIAGAGLDVFEREPQVHPALIAMPNVVLMPHVGSATREARLKMASAAAESLRALLDGERPPNVVNPEAFR